ncbi:MAG: carboxypeptidase regulatory-like domain-containing protein [Terriglobia bacterium]
MHIQDPKGNPIQGVTVALEGQGALGLTDSSGNYDFGTHPAGTYSVFAKKDGFTPAPANQSKSAPSGVVTQFIIVLQPPRVTQIAAAVPGTKSRRTPSKNLGNNVLRPSSSADESLKGNAAVILVRGCTSVELSAQTSPADQPVTWNVKPNENKESAPAWSSTGTNKIKLSTDKTGSFSVIATLYDSKVVWNVIFVWVNIDPSTSIITKKENQFWDKSQAGWVTFLSGDFTPSKLPWQAQVSAKLVGGGAKGSIGIDKIHLKVLQNGTADTVTGHYGAGDTAAHDEPSLPILDNNNASGSLPPPYLTDASVFKVTPNDTGASRTVWAGDAPADGLPPNHNVSGNPLTAVTGGYGFQTAVGSISDDAPNSLVLHAMTTWNVDFKGKTFTSHGILRYKPDGPSVRKDAAFSLVSPATGGQDACDAGFEVMGPIWNDPPSNPPATLKWY